MEIIKKNEMPNFQPLENLPTGAVFQAGGELFERLGFDERSPSHLCILQEALQKMGLVCCSNIKTGELCLFVKEATVRRVDGAFVENPF